MSYKLNLIKALPNEMKFLSSYAYTIGAKLIVDEAAWIGFTKEDLEVNYSDDQDAVPPEGVLSYNGVLAVPTEDNLESKKLGIAGLHQWAQKLNSNFYRRVDILQLPEDAPVEEQVATAVIVQTQS